MWYKFYGFKENPFYVKSNSLVLGLEKEKKQLINYIIGGNICFLNGEAGSGKTSLLKWTKENLKGHTIVYIDAESTDEFFNLYDYMKMHKSFLQFYRVFPKKIVILLDEANTADENLKKALKIAWEEGIIKSVVITQIQDLDNLSQAFKSRIGERKIELKPMPLTEIYNLIDKRTRGKNPFTEDAIALIAETADYTPRKVLELCERTCINLHEKGKKHISSIDVTPIISESAKTEVVKDALDIEDIFKDADIGKIEETLIKKDNTLSPMQERIMNLLQQPKTTQQLAQLLNTTEGSVGKQLSQLSIMNKIKVVDDRRPKKYGLV